MRIIRSLVFLSVILCFGTAFAGPPPYSSITISGKAQEPLTKVGLFKDVRHTRPMAFSAIDKKTRDYSITVDVRKQMNSYGSGLIGVDMIFWNDKNDNGKRDKGEAKSSCHFVMWDSKKRKMVFQAYDGPTHYIKSNNFRYDYGYILTEEIIPLKNICEYVNYSKVKTPIQEKPDQNSKVLDSLKPRYAFPLRGVLRSGWVVLDCGINGFLYNPKFVQLSLVPFDVEPFSGKFVALETDVPIYRQPSLEAEVISTLKKGYQKKIVGRVKGKDWYQLDPYGYGRKGHIVSDNP